MDLTKTMCIADEVDTDGELEIELTANFDQRSISEYITKEEAIILIAHIQKVFGLSTKPNIREAWKL